MFTPHTVAVWQYPPAEFNITVVLITLKSVY